MVFNHTHYLMWYEDRWPASPSDSSRSSSSSSAATPTNPGYALAAALHPAGPFHPIADSVVMGGRGKVGDFDVFVDPDTGRGYHVRTGLTIQPLDATMSRSAAVD